MPIWIDEIAEVVAWETEFIKDEAEEVVEALGAWIYCFRKPQDDAQLQIVERTMQAVQKIIEKHSNYGADTVMLAVALPEEKVASISSQFSPEDLEDVCLPYGFEFIEFSAKGKNEFGEHVGAARLKEALEANEWPSAGTEDDEDIDIDDLVFGTDDVGAFEPEEAEMTAELFEMKRALMEDDDLRLEEADIIPAPEAQAAQVDGLDRMMSKLMAVKEAAADFPEAQRRKMAAKAIKDLLQHDPVNGS